jgi:uncharacterized protein YfaP (DUF2135 family)
MRSSAPSSWLLVSLVLLLGSGARATARPLTVKITEPTNGVLEADYTVELRARVSDPRVRTALLAVNGAVYDVPVRGGRIKQTVVAVPGNNRVGIVVRRGGRVARDSLTFYLRGARTDLIVLLTWPTRGEIIDLWVREPGGETCKWDHRQTGSGGRLLDFSEDAIGFGSQAFVLPRIRAGRYRIKVHYWGAYGRDDARGFWAYSELMERLDRLDAGLGRKLAPARREALRRKRAALARRLDRWASPAAPQTRVRGEAILFPGTRHERRWRFAVTSQRTGQLLSLGEAEVSAAMIRAARAGAGRTP